MRRKTTATTIFRIGALFAFVVASACSIVNSFDDVKPLSEGTYTPVPPIAEAGGGPSDAGGEGGPRGPAGVIVVGGETRDDGGVRAFVLLALDPATGREIGPRETMTVAGVRYDGLRDLWYVFEAKGTPDFIPGPSDTVVLHVRAFDALTGKWTDRASIAVPPLQNYESIGVVRERLSYVAHPTSVGGSLRLVTVNTSDPASPAVIDQLDIDRAPLGMIATRSVTGPGGVVNLVRVNTAAGACTNNICPIEIVRFLVPNAGSTQVAAPITVASTPRTAIPGFASFSLAERDMVVIPRLANDASTTISLFDPRNQNKQETAPASFYMTDSALRRAAVAECTHTAFIIGTNGDLDLHAVPVLGDGGGTPTAIPTGHSGQAVYFEPNTKTVLAPFGQGAGFDYSAFRLTGTAEAPALARRTTADWNPPTDVRPILIAVRDVLPVTCP